MVLDLQRIGSIHRKYPAVRSAGTCFQNDPWKMLLSRCLASRKRSDSGPRSVPPCSANCSHGSPGRRFLLLVLPFTASDVVHGSTPFCRYFGIAAVPKAVPFRGIRMGAIASFGRFGVALWASLPRMRTMWDSHRSDSSAILRRRNHQTPRFSPKVHPGGCRFAFPSDEIALRPYASTQPGAWRFPSAET